MWEGEADEKGIAWLYVDFGRPHKINRYVVKCAGVVGLAPAYNLRDFRIEYSHDGQQWTTVSTVTANTLGQVQNHIKPVSARYFRLYITGANSSVSQVDKNLVYVSEWELYGVPDGEATSPLITEDPFVPDEESLPDEETAPEEPEDTATSDEDVSTGEGPSKKPVQTVTTVTFFPWWAWLLIALGVVAAIGAVVVILVIRRKKKTTAT